MARNPKKQRCKAKSKQRNEQCKNWAKPGWDVCRFHGAGGGAPSRNTNAVKTGEHQTLWMDALTPEQQEIVERVNLDPLEQINQSITLYAWREREIMMKIAELEKGLTEKQRRVLQERVTIKEPVQVLDEKTGKPKTVILTRNELATTEIEETEYRAIEDILNLQEALTRVTDKKIKAIDLLARLTDDMRQAQLDKIIQSMETEKAKLQLEKERVEIEKAKIKGNDDGGETVEDWVTAIQTIAARRRRKETMKNE